MGYQIIPNVVFILSVFGIILIVLKNLPKAATIESQKQQDNASYSLAEKGLPVLAISKIKTFFQFWGKKIWNFILEAKDLRHAATTGYKIKKILQKNTNTAIRAISTQQTEPNELSEQNYIERIKATPKDLNNYDNLGQLYLNQEDFGEAKDIYIYLTSHDSGNSNFFARLAFASYKLRDFQEAAKNYKKSLALDSTHPNRYYNLGLSYKALGNYNSAKQAFQKAVELEPQNLKYEVALKNIMNI